jgi:hypothetical protein
MYYKPLKKEVIAMTNSQRIYQTLFTYINKIIEQRATTIKNLCLLMTGVFISHSIHLSQIGNEFPIRGKTDSLVQRIRRFLKNQKISDREIYKPIAQRVIQAASVGGRIRLIVDVTDLYGNLKIFSVSVAYRRRAVPLVWEVMDEAGITDAATQIEIFDYVASLLPKGVEIVLIGDGEFRSTELMGWLYTKRWHYRLRVAKDTYIKDEYGEWKKLQDLGLSKGETIFLQKVLLTQTDPTGPVNIAMTWEKGEDEPWYIVTDQPANWGTLSDYKVRMWIEEMHGDFKGQGLHLDQTHLRDTSLISRLFLALSIVYVWLMHTGSWVIKRGWRSLVDKKYRRDLSVFHIGYYWLLRQLAQALSLHVGLKLYFYKNLAKVTGS